MVNFTCGHCGKLIAVERDLLDREVECPHCRQFVQAPLPVALPDPPHDWGAEPPESVFEFPRPAEAESIFGEEPHAGDDLFSDARQAPAIEMPADFTRSFSVPSSEERPATENIEKTNSSEAASSSEDGPTQDLSFFPQLAESPPVPMGVEAAGGGIADDLGLSSQMRATDGTEHTEKSGIAQYSVPGVESVEPSQLGSSPPEAFSQDTKLRNRDSLSRSTNTLVFSTLIFLVPYAIFMTAAAAYYYYQWKQVPSPLELLPDWPGDNPGATRDVQTSFVTDQVAPETRLPEKLQVFVGETLRVGDLEVTPQKVERRPVVYRSERPDVSPESSGADALVLTLELRNASRDDNFVPTDAAFTNRWKHSPGNPYTFLEIGSQRFYGGPFKWARLKETSSFATPTRANSSRAKNSTARFCFREQYG